MTRDEFIRAATEMYGDRYDYSSVTEEGVLNNTNVSVKCSSHGMFYITPYQLLHGLIGGCFECYREKIWENDREKGL